MLETSIKMNGPTDGVQEVYRTWTAPEYSSSVWGRRYLMDAWGYCSVTLVIKIIGQLSLFFIICSNFSIYNLTIHIHFPRKWGNVMIILIYGTGSILWSSPKSTWWSFWLWKVKVTVRWSASPSLTILLQKNFQNQNRVLVCF